MTKNAAEILRDARKLIADEAHWTTFFSAMNASGCPVEVMGEDATRFCASGAVVRAGGGYNDGQYEAWKIFKTSCLPELATTFNDTHTHAEVLAMFDKAIAAAKSATA